MGTVIKFHLTKLTENILHFANISERHASEVSVLLALEAMYIFSRFAKGDNATTFCRVKSQLFQEIGIDSRELLSPFRNY